jgi:hypothetical protein
MLDDAVDAQAPRDRRLVLLVSAYVALYAAANVGSVLAPHLVRHDPTLLLALSARIRHLLFAVPAGISPLAYAAVGFVRLLAAAVVCYLLGRWFGARGFAWLDRQLGEARPATLRWLETATDRAGWLAVVLLPGSNIVCALVGHRRQSPKVFASLISVGIALRLWWVWVAAQHFRSPLHTALGQIDRYQWWLMGGFLALSVLQALRRTRGSGTDGSGTTPA